MKDSKVVLFDFTVIFCHFICSSLSLLNGGSNHPSVDDGSIAAYLIYMHPLLRFVYI